MPSESDRDLELVERHLNELGEHFDTVQIFCTRHEPEIEQGTVAVSKGTGNWYARMGQVSAWIEREREGERIKAREVE